MDTMSGGGAGGNKVDIQAQVPMWVLTTYWVSVNKFINLYESCFHNLVNKQNTHLVMLV